jgi:hypothetical protein
LETLQKIGFKSIPRALIHRELLPKKNKFSELHRLLPLESPERRLLIFFKFNPKRVMKDAIDCQHSIEALMAKEPSCVSYFFLQFNL